MNQNQQPLLDVAQNVPARGELPFLIFDCETSGLPLRGRGPDDKPWPADHPRQPRMAALAMIWTTPALSIIKEKRWLIKPDGWLMEPGATKVNGLTDNFLKENGGPIGPALDAFEEAVAEGHIFVAHNVVFDAKIIRGELRRAGRPDHREQTLTVCTMMRSAGVVKAKKLNGSPKTPRLEEMAAHFKIEVRGRAHTAGTDAHTCLQGLRWLMKLGIDLEPKVITARGGDPELPPDMKW